MAFTYDRATTKLIYGLPPDREYGRWNGTFNNGITSWRTLVQQRITGGTLNTLRILVVGCGLGLMVEGLKDEGFSRAWGINLNDYFGSLWDQATCPVMTNGGRWMDTSTSPWTDRILAPGQQWPCEVRADIRPLLGKFDIRTMTATNVGTLTGLSGAQRQFDLIFTEDVMTNYALAEMEAIYAACDARLAGGGQVRHLVTLNWNPGYWATDGTWVALNGAPAMDLTQWTATLGGRTNHQFQDISVSQAVG